MPTTEKIKIEVTTENKCSFCTASICCTYITQQVDTPRSKADFEHLLWQISHENIRIYKDEDGWTLLVESKCLHLQVNGDCGIYDVRPTICRDHTNDYCEYDAPSEDGFELYFNDYHALRTYCQKRFKKWDK